MEKKNIYKFRCLLLMLSLFVSGSIKAQETYSISGNVKDEKGQQLPGAVIFLTGTKTSAATNTYGNFQLTNISPGTYQLVVKMLGYKPYLEQIIVTDENITMRIKIVPDVQQLNVVVVKPDKAWFKSLEIFKTQFLGETENADHCKLMNSEVLALEYDKKTKIMRAHTDELLIIKNQALGYQLKYLLTNFEYNGNKNTIVYQGYPFFEELKGSPQEEALWKDHRNLAYYGSIHHFIRSVYNKSVLAEGYLVYKIKNRMPLGGRYTTKKPIAIDYHPVSFDSLLTSNGKNFKWLNYKDALFVIFTKEKEAGEYRNKNYTVANAYNYIKLPEGQVSIINLFKPVVIDGRGSFRAPSDLFFEGYMGYEKIADLMPFEYTPDE